MNKEELRMFQLCQLKALKQIDAICKREGLTYYAHTGTLLGAVRNHGYIPWDGDTDILMPEADANKLKRAISQDKVSRIVYVSAEDSWVCSDRILLLDVKFYRGEIKNKLDQYAHIDIYKYGYSKITNLTKSVYSRLIWFINRLIEFKSGFKDVTNRYLLFKKIVLRSADLLTRKTSTGTLRNVIRDISVSKKKKDYIVVYNSYYGVDRELYKAELFSASKDFIFEDMIIPVPIGYDHILTQLYGNWHELPPVEKRYSPHLNEYIFEVIDSSSM